MTAHVTPQKIEVAIRAVAKANWRGPVELDLRTGVLRLLPEGAKTEQSDAVDLDMVDWKR